MSTNISRISNLNPQQLMCNAMKYAASKAPITFQPVGQLAYAL